MTFPLQAFDADNKSIRIGKQNHNHETGVYRTTNIFAYQSTWGTSVLRDVETTTGTGSISLNDGAIRLSTGTTAGSTVDLATRRNGEYQPGKTAEIGAGVKVVTKPTGDGVVRIGIYDDNDGFFFQLEANDVIKIVTRRNGTDTVITQQNFNGDTLDGGGDSDNLSGKTYNQATPYIYTVRFSYYGVGPAIFLLHQATDDFFKRAASPEMLDLIAHREVLDNFPSITDPNQKVRIDIDNGTSTTDIVVDVGGRRYDILGDFEPEIRPTGEYRFGASVGTSLTPVVALRKKSQFPSGQGRNTVNSYVWGFEVYSDTDLVFWVFTGGTVNGTWGVPSQRSNGETSLESNKTLTTLTGGEPILGPFIAKASGQGNNTTPGQTTQNKLFIPLSGTDAVVIAGISSSGTATVDATLIINEDW